MCVAHDGKLVHVSFTSPFLFPIKSEDPQKVAPFFKNFGGRMTVSLPFNLSGILCSSELRKMEECRQPVRKQNGSYSIQWHGWLVRSHRTLFHSQLSNASVLVAHGNWLSFSLVISLQHLIQ
uniref:Uncharacterized protein n=1 Tax=Opuntia streptacantha TaxID=393608 RepID=A0A7C8Z213_OPUST